MGLGENIFCSLIRKLKTLTADIGIYFKPNTTLGLVVLNVECAQESPGELIDNVDSQVPTPKERSDVLNRGRSLGICIPPSAASVLDANPEPSFQSRFKDRPYSSSTCSFLFIQRADRMDKDDPEVHHKLPPKWAKKDEHTFTFQSGLKQIPPYSIEHNPLFWFFGNGRWGMVNRNPELMWDQGAFSVHRAAQGSSPGASSKRLYLCKGLLSLSGHATVGCTAVLQASWGRSSTANPLPSHPASPWFSSWLIQGNPERLTLNLMAPVGSWEIASNLSPSAFFFFKYGNIF